MFKDYFDLFCDQPFNLKDEPILDIEKPPYSIRITSYCLTF